MTIVEYLGYNREVMADQPPTYCVTNGIKTFEGTKEQIVTSAVDLTLEGESRTITIKRKGSNETPLTLNGYVKVGEIGGGYTDEEAYTDAIRTVFDQLGRYGYRVYRSLAWNFK